MVLPTAPLFLEGVRQAEEALGAEVRDYDRVLRGVAFVLRGANGAGASIADLIAELASLFHDPLSMVDPARMPLEEIVRGMESTLRHQTNRERLGYEIREILARQLPYVFNGGRDTTDADLEDWIAQLERELAPGGQSPAYNHKLSYRLESARSLAAHLRRRIEIVEALAGGERSDLQGAKEMAADLAATSDWVESAARARIDDLRARLANRPRERAQELKPLNELQTRIQKGWRGSFAEPGEYLTDGCAILCASAMRKADARALAERIPEKIQKGELKPLPQARVSDRFREEVSVPSEAAELLGWRPDRGCQDNVAYLLAGGEIAAYCSAHRLAAVLKRIPGAEMRVSTDRAKVIFLKDGEPIAILLPFDYSSIGASTKIEIPETPLS